ncbi:hypothetical protein R8510_04399 [Ralstonia chuxiongensis]|nr:hypothetical protein R8510_04399 [Ralstonia chuxiongensis]
MSRRYVVGLACLCTLVAVLLSVAGAWGRAGLPVERALFAAVAVLLTVGAHVIPALCRDTGAWFRLLAAVLWLACMAAVVVGHLAFFTAAERHAGEMRAIEAQTVERSTITARPLSEVAADLAGVNGSIARLRVDVARCPSCQSLPAKLEALTARARALETEEAEARRRITQEEEAVANRQAATVDPVSRRLAVTLGVTHEAASLAVGVVSAVVLELLGCLLWVKVTRWSTSTTHQAPLLDESRTVTACKSVMVADLSPDGHRSTNPARNEPVKPEIAGTVTRSHAANVDEGALAEAIRRGIVRPTVTAIRTYLKCSQSRAIELRRAWLASTKEKHNERELDGQPHGSA